jgi:hypothetical protein
MSTILPPNPNKPLRSAFYYAANGCLYLLAVSLTIQGLVLKFVSPSASREAALSAIPCSALFILFCWNAKKGMDQDG